MDMPAGQIAQMDAREFARESSTWAAGGQQFPFASSTPTGNMGPQVQSPAPTAASSSATTSSTPAVQFEMPVKKPQDRIFNLQQQTQHDLNYYHNEGVSLDYVQWLSRSNGSSVYQRIALAKYNSNLLQPSQPQGLLEWQKHGVRLLLDNLSISTASTKSGMSLRSESDSPYGKQMVIRVGWTQAQTQGYSQSGVFTVVQNVDDPNLEILVGQWLDESDGVSAPDTIISTGGTSSLAPAATEPPPGDPGTQPGNGIDSGGGGGLSAGAIAGIAVGGAVVLILICALAWFLLRRRRRSRDQHAGDYKPGHHTPNAAYLEDKDLHTGQVADSPRSPYSEDGQGVPRLAPLPAAATAPLAVHGHATGDDTAEYRNSATAASFDPYRRSDAAGSRGNLTDTDARSTQTPQNVSRNVAHLVEDGMTEDEIRRLEEEERQLDAEIERAGRR
ncbi:hypothetical protein O9K51_00866 [Purpureocillium lavendulum]|uniref:Uncharacterized protein n=1 Tax=Purpureocillium lavendulum TaxID=1247861 RepID=A0AB34G3S6_9HYPO|nr:hypothetical protein O9K51_00866 [Purpureocillium lavendulum]